MENDRLCIRNRVYGNDLSDVHRRRTRICLLWEEYKLYNFLSKPVGGVEPEEVYLYLDRVVVLCENLERHLKELMRDFVIEDLVAQVRVHDCGVREAQVREYEGLVIGVLWD